MIALFQNDTPAYNGKFISALQESLKYLGADTKFWSLIKDNKGSVEVKTIVSDISDISLMLTPRNTRKACVIPCFLLPLISERVKKHFLGLVKPNIGITSYDYSLEIIGKIDFSGYGLWTMNKLIEGKSWLFPYTPGKMSVKEYVDCAKQLLIHCCIGTQFEDLSILRTLYGEKVIQWKSRSALGSFFQKMFTSEQSIGVNLPLPKYASKLTSACMTNFMPTPKPNQLFLFQ